MKPLLTTVGSDTICRSWIAGASLIGAAMAGEGLEEEGSLGKAKLLGGTDCECSRWRPCTAAGVWAGAAGGRKERSWPLDCSDGKIWVWGFLGGGSGVGLKLSCLFGTEDPLDFFMVAWPLSFNLFWSDSKVVGFKVRSVWGCWARRFGAAFCWGSWGRWSWSSFRPKVWGAEWFWLLSLDACSTGVLWTALLVRVVVRSPLEEGINFLLWNSWRSAESAWTEIGWISWRRKKKLCLHRKVTIF